MASVIRIVHLVAGLLLLSSAGGIHAQASGSLETGTLIPVRPAGGYGTAPSDVRQVVRRFSACSVGRGRTSVEMFLAAPVSSSEYIRLRRRVLVDDCLGAGELTISDAIIRGALFEQLYIADFKSQSALDLSNAPRVDYRAPYSTIVTPQAGQAIALAELGDCVARRAASKARALLLVEPGSSAESAAFAELSPELGPCVPKGQRVALSRSIVRGGLAEGLYRVSRSAVDTSAAAMP